MIAVIDYDAGNIMSAMKALEYIGEKPILTRDTKEILASDKVILPGVGSFGNAMEKLHQYGMIEVLHQVADHGTPLLGICLGLQLLFERSEEAEGIHGLGILKGEVVRIPDKKGYKIPHMGWNSLKINDKSKLFQGVPEDSYVYFVHSYYLKAAEEADVAATTDYIVNIHAAAEHDNIFATQFHPEKSGEVGLHILKNFVNL